MRTTDDTWVGDLLGPGAAGESWGARSKRGGRWAAALAVPATILAITFHGGTHHTLQPTAVEKPRASVRASESASSAPTPRTTQMAGIEALRALQPVSRPVQAPVAPPPEPDIAAPQDPQWPVDAPPSSALPWKPPGPSHGPAGPPHETPVVPAPSTAPPTEPTHPQPSGSDPDAGPETPTATSSAPATPSESGSAAPVAR